MLSVAPRLALDVQADAERLALVARTIGTAGPGFGEQVEENERLIRLLEQPALAAETVIARELRDGRGIYRRASSSR